jgi:hypothetical protein
MQWTLWAPIIDILVILSGDQSGLRSQALHIDWRDIGSFRAYDSVDLPNIRHPKAAGAYTLAHVAE